MKTLKDLKKLVSNLKNVSSLATLQTELFEFCDEFTEQETRLEEISLLEEKLQERDLELKVLSADHDVLQKQSVELETQCKGLQVKLQKAETEKKSK